MATDTPIDESLRLARDLCLGVGAFYVTEAGSVFSNMSDVMRPDNADDRVAALARSCLIHPSARGTGLFWSAESTDDGGSLQPEWSLACVVVPVWRGDRWLGLLGVVDVWLPELDEEQRAGLLALASGVSDQAGRGEAAATAAQDTSGAASAPGWPASGAPSPEPGVPGSGVPGSGVPGSGVPGSAASPSTVPGVPGVSEPGAAGAPEPGVPGAPGAPGVPGVPGSLPVPGSPTPGSPTDDRRSDTSGEPFLGEILDHLPDGLLVARSDGTIVLVNQTFAQMTGLPLDSVLGEDVTQVLALAPAQPGHVGDAPAPEVARDVLVEDLLGEGEPGRTVLVAGDGPSGGVTLDASGRRIESRFAGDCFITLVRAAGAAGIGGQGGSRIEQAGIQALLDHIEDGIVCCDSQGNVVIANRAARRLQGLSDGELRVGASLPSVVRLQTLEGHDLSVDEHPLVRSMLDDVPVSEEFLLRGDDVERYVSISSHPLRVDGGDGAIAVLRDVTAERERQAHLTRYALYDPLTGVANRYLLNDALGRMLEALHRRGGSVSLIYLDLDRFKEINDEHGHETGDELLRAVAMRLGRAVRGEDIVSRLGGDEFVVAHVTAERLSDGDSVVARVRKVLTAPYRFGDLVLDVGASIGWVSTSSGDDSPESLIAQADRAMYEQKHQRRAAEHGAPA